MQHITTAKCREDDESCGRAALDDPPCCEGLVCNENQNLCQKAPKTTASQKEPKTTAKFTKAITTAKCREDDESCGRPALDDPPCCEGLVCNENEYLCQAPPPTKPGNLN